MKNTTPQWTSRLMMTIPPMLVLVLCSTIAQAQQTDDQVARDTLETRINEIIEQDDEDDEDESGNDSVFFLARNTPDTVYVRKSGDSVVAGLLEDDDFWYANAVFKKKEEEKRKGASDSFFDTKAFETILWFCVIGGFIAVLIIYLHNNNASLFRSSKTIKNTEEDFDAETDDIFNINYSREIDRAVNSGNYRLGVRLLFLQLLKDLSVKNIIQYKHDRTNLDYLMQVSQASWYPVFFRLTRNYEYAWYGHFEMDRDKFDMIRKDFTGLQKQLPTA